MMDIEVLKARCDGLEFTPDRSLASPIDKWLKLFDERPVEFVRLMMANYGESDEVIDKRCDLYLSVCNSFKLKYGEKEEVYALACPSRINWEGHHVDHQGGHYNSTTDQHEMIMICSPRSDSNVHITNIDDEKFASADFSLEDNKFVNNDDYHWGNYIKGGFLSVAKRSKVKLKGADIAVGSDIPIGASLSSSHAIVICSMLSALASNKLKMDKREAVICVQEGEWFTGSRTGLGDQASMILGKKGKIFNSKVITQEEIEPKYADIPKDHALIIINSFSEHQLRGDEKLGYNARVFAYKIAYPLVLGALLDIGASKESISKAVRLAEITPERFSTINIYRALLAIPETMSLSEAQSRIDAIRQKMSSLGLPLKTSEVNDLLKIYFGDGPYPETIQARGVAMYGLAEARRSVLFTPLVQEGKLKSAGELVYAGHDGDRVFSFNERTEKYEEYPHPVTDDYLKNLIADLNSGDKTRIARAELGLQPGDYSASILVLDELVDLCKNCGAISASLTGAGLGGVVTAFVPFDRLPGLRQAVYKFYLKEETKELEDFIQNKSLNEIFDAVEAEKIKDRIARIMVRKRRDKRLLKEDSNYLNILIQNIDDKCKEKNISAPKMTFIGADYYQNGILRNISVAGAGYIIPI